jgi:hypothetical protein
MKHCKSWDYKGIKHIPTGAGFLPPYVPIETSIYRLSGWWFGT